MEEKVHEVLMTRMYTMRTSMLPGQSAGAIRNAQMHDIKPQVIGCISWWVEEDRRADGTTGNGAATGWPRVTSRSRTEKCRGVISWENLPHKITPRGCGGRRAAEVIDAEVTREQALTQVFLGKDKPRVSMILLLPSKQPLQTQLRMVELCRITLHFKQQHIGAFLQHLIQPDLHPYLPIVTSWEVHKPSFTLELPNWTKLKQK